MSSSVRADRKSILEKLRQKHQENETNVRRRSIQGNPRPLSYKSSSSDHSDGEISDKNLLKILAECRANLDRTEALKRANPQLLRPEDYVSLDPSFLHSDDSHYDVVVMNNEIDVNKNVRCGNVEQPKIIRFKTQIKPETPAHFETHADRHNGIVKNSSRSRHDVKGFFHYVLFVTSYVILLFIVTFMITQTR